MSQPTNATQGFVDVLSQDASLADIAKRARALEELDLQLRAALPAATAAKCRVINVREGLLVVMARSPVFAARVRIAQGDLLAKAKALGLEVTGIVTRVGGWELPQDEPVLGKPLSAKAAAELENTAAELGEDDDVADAIRRLARTSRASAPKQSR